MYSDRKLAGKGLQYVFWGVIASLAGTLLSFVPLVGLVLLLAGIACEIYGYITAAKSDTGYMNAVFCLGGNLVAEFLKGILGTGVLASLFGVISSILSLAAVYFMCQTTGRLLEASHPELAIRAAMLWKLYLACAVVSVVCAVLGVIPLIGILAGVLGWVVALAMLVADVLYLIFLYQAQNALR